MKDEEEQQQQKQEKEEEEEGAPLVVADDGCAQAPAPAQSKGSRTWASLLSPTRGAVGVGIVIAGLVFLALLAAVTTGSGWIHLNAPLSFLLPGIGGGGVGRRPPHHTPSSLNYRVPIPFSCGGRNETARCPPRAAARSPAPSPAAAPDDQHQARRRPPPPPSCPDYFRHIHSDLEPWRAMGITREAVESARPRAAFRLVVVGGRGYVETYHRVFQTRDLFTQWGIAQLLARYPGRVPDLDLMFNCEDMPEVRAADFQASPSSAPPLFRYCKDDSTLDILFPDWSFWGWPEVNIRPWAPLMATAAAENARLPWHDREPYAFWKGNPDVSPARGDLFRCNASDVGMRLFRQDWEAARRNGYRDSDPARQCRHRFRLYVQGRSWSVSEKYILACDSPMLAVDTPYRDFFSRGLVTGEHYWPIDADPARKCRSVKLAVQWGNAHPAQAQRMAAAGSGFAREEMSMDFVYDYMLHVFTEYSKLLRYTPTVPEKAVELCPEALACPESGKNLDFMMESRESFVAGYEPCALPPPFSGVEAEHMARREQKVRASIRTMEDRMQMHP